ncbi:MAG: MerR family transcriptional regulator [Candidatus Altimarinota bacterium]
MSYTVQQLAKLAGVSVRTLHHYDQIGLLKPARVEKNGYRKYEERELLQLQQILFFRELDFPLEEVMRVMTAPGFDLKAALNDQRKLIELKKKRLNGLIKTIDKTINKLNQKNQMKDEELYGSFDKDEMNQYAEEAKQRWGHTDAYKQSQERYAKMSKEDLQKLKEDGEKWCAKLATMMDLDPAGAEVQAMIAEHYNSLRTWYEPNLKMYRGLADMYVADARFTAYYDKHAPGLAKFLQAAMHAYCEAKGN